MTRVLKPFPLRMLVVPALMPVAVMMYMSIREALGHQWNVHGDAIGVVGLMFLSAIAAAIVQSVALFKAMPRLWHGHSERKPANIIATAFASLCVALVVLPFFYFIARSLVS